MATSSDTPSAAGQAGQNLRSAAKNAIPQGVRRRIAMARGRVPRPTPSVVTAPTPPEPDPLDRVVLNTIIGTWMEADVIADTVRNAFAQGSDRVFIVDNNSPDDTTARAGAAGAEHAITFSTEVYDEAYRIGLMNRFMLYQSTHTQADHVWWLWADADEFPRPAEGGTIRQLLTSLDRRYRVVGGRFINHYPTPGCPAYREGHHPIDDQPLAEELSLPVCSRGHRKHPLLRWDRHGPPLEADLGFHRPKCVEEPLLEPPASLAVHHFPFRERSATEERLHALWFGADSASRALRGDATSLHMEARLDSIDAVYDGRWADVKSFVPGSEAAGVALTDWRQLKPTLSTDVVRWGVT